MKIPETFDEALDWVINNVEGVQKFMKQDAEKTFLAHGHMSFGQWIRNNWGFWREEGPLYFWFLTLGIKHPDDMSGIIITSAYRKFHNKPIKLEEQVQHYKDFWDRQGDSWPKEPGT